jgi:aspartate racemase
VNERDTPVIGLLGGLGVGAAMHYYRELAAAHDDEARPMSLVMVHASIARATGYASRGDRAGLARYLAGLLAQLQAAGATFGVLPAVTPHLCIEQLQEITPLPVIDLTAVVSDHVRRRGLSRVALFGTRYVVESGIYGRLTGVSVVRPRPDEVAFIHEAYTQLAHTGVVSTPHYERFVVLAGTLQRRDSVDAIVLAGTDFAVMFDESNTPFPHVDCTRAHLEVILQQLRAPAVTRRDANSAG